MTLPEATDRALKVRNRQTPRKVQGSLLPLWNQGHPHVKKGSIMQGFADNFIPVIPEDEGEMLHTQSNPFCPVDPTCLCHEDPLLIAEVAQYVANGELTPQEATDFVNGRMI